MEQHFCQEKKAEIYDDKVLSDLRACQVYEPKKCRKASDRKNGRAGAMPWRKSCVKK